MLYFYGKLPKNRLKVVNRDDTEKSNCRADLAGVSRSERPKCLAIVGTRKPTRYGEEIAYQLAFEAAKRGAVVVSGLAYGIDSVAHRGALDAGGVTVAVLGTPIDYIYPRTHEKLAQEIVEKGGCVMSELNRGESFYFKGCFLQRNRIIAGLSDVVVIPEAAERSGSLNTAAHALEQGREVFAVPGDIRRPLSMGCNRLIEQGARLCLSVDDMVEALFPAPRRGVWSEADVSRMQGDDEAETALLRAIAGGEDDGEKLMRRLKMSVEVFTRTMTMLEIKGRVRALGGNVWMLRR